MGVYGKKLIEQKAAELRAEKEEAEKKEKETTALAVSSLTSLAKNQEMAQMYTESAKVGSDNLSGELPLLKVHAVGKSTKNELADGQEPVDGNFFYKPTLEQFKEITCHILTISRGFRAVGLEDGKTIFNQIVGGVIINEGEMKPFIMYMTGLKLQPLWDFGREAAKYTRLRPFPIPMFTLSVRMTTEKKSNSFGKSWIINFEILKNSDGSPVLVLDQSEFKFLRDHVETIEETIEGIISAKTIKDEEKPIENVDPKDIPF